MSDPDFLSFRTRILNLSNICNIVLASILIGQSYNRVKKYKKRVRTLFLSCRIRIGFSCDLEPVIRKGQIHLATLKPSLKFAGVISDQSDTLLIIPESSVIQFFFGEKLML